MCVCVMGGLFIDSKLREGEIVGRADIVAKKFDDKREVVFSLTGENETL